MSQPRIFKVRTFERWRRKTMLTDDALRAAVAEMAEIRYEHEAKQEPVE